MTEDLSMSKNIELSEQQIKEISAQFVQITEVPNKKIGDWKLYYKGDLWWLINNLSVQKLN